MKRALLASILFAAATAHADDAKPEPPKPAANVHQLVEVFDPLSRISKAHRDQHADRKPADERAADDVANAPLPGQESGRVDPGEHDSVLRDIGQAVLTVPRVAVETVFAPVRTGLWAYEHYDLGTRAKRIAFDHTNTYGVYPTVYINSDYGATFGGRFVHRNLFGAREHFAMRAAFGGEFNQLADAGFRSGDRFGNSAWLELRGEFEQRPHDPFYGIGNMNDVPSVHHRQQLERGTATLDLRADTNTHVRFNGAITDLSYGVSDDMGLLITEAYGSEMLTGWTGTRNLYGELEVRYDTRRYAPTLEHDGTLLDAFGGRIYQLEDSGNNYYRYGGEAIHFVPLGIGRTLATRLHFEAVTGSYQDVAFTQLPELGGKFLLRGYPVERFRDRVALTGTSEYMWDLNEFLLASVFVDTGRVYSALDDINADNMRVGYGVSLQMMDRGKFFAGVSAASSIDGGLFLNLVLDPVYEPEPRVRQK